MGKRSREKRDRRIEAPRQARVAVPDPHVSDPAPRPGRPPSPPPFGELVREHGMAVVALFALALVVRGLLLAEIARTPFFEVGNIDSVGYHQWATRIAEGAWWPAGTFYQSPLYAYFLAVLYSLFGAGSWSPRIVQIVLGSLGPVLTYAIATRLFGRRVGWIAGVVLALYGPLILEEITFSKTTLLVVTSLAGFAVYLWKAPAGEPRALALAGVLFGVSVVGVGQWLLPFVALAAWTPMMAERLPRPRRLRAALAFAAGGLAVILPLVVWNSANGGGLVLTSGDAGLNFYTGNNERASGLPASPAGLRNTPQYEEADGRMLAEKAVGRPLSPAEVSRYWSSQGVAWITRHPGDFVDLVGKKLVTLWNGFEISDNYHYAFMRAHFLPLLHVAATFGLVAPFALVGAVMPFWRRRDVTALYLVCFGYLATLLIFYVRGRYRIPAVPFLTVLAAVAAERVVRAVEAARWPAVAALGGGLAVAGVFTNHEYCEPTHHGLAAVCLGGDTWFDDEWLKLAEWYRNAGQTDRAIAFAERAQECTRPRSRATIATWIAELETIRTEELVREGRLDEAGTHFTHGEASYRSVLALGRAPARTQSYLGSLYAIYGRPADAVASFEAAQSAGALDPAATRRFARAYVDLGRCADAERVLGGLDRARGLASPSDETRAMLAGCVAKP
jgi:4-amino-4-deoxy-L-arabinose transferase-like glycosyltransferase